LTYKLLLRSCKLMGVFVISPLPPILLELLQTVFVYQPERLVDSAC
jgi:hypothetical protein